MKSKWRLPTVDELQGIFDYEAGKPKIDGFAPNNYWSSTVYADDTYDAWIVNFDNGSTYGYNKSYTYCVRCVKKTKKGKLKWSKSHRNRMTWDKANKYCKGLNK